MLVGGIELGLAVYPIERSPEWEFATAVTLVSGLPVPLMGLALVLASALKRRARLTARIAGTLCLLGAAGMLGGLVIFGLTIPVALRFINEPIVREGLMKAIFKTSSQGVVYAVALSVMGYQGWRRAKSASHTEETRDDSVTASS